jgi:hypothetical protein
MSRCFNRYVQTWGNGIGSHRYTETLNAGESDPAPAASQALERVAKLFS